MSREDPRPAGRKPKGRQDSGAADRPSTEDGAGIAGSGSPQATQPSDEVTSAIAAPEMAPAIVLLDDQGVVVAVNHAWKASPVVRAFRAKSSGIGHPYFKLVASFVPHVGEAEFRSTLEELRNGQRQEVRYPYALETADGPLWREARITVLALGGETRFVVIHEDLSALVHAQSALRDVAEQLLTVRDEERQRIAADLHDSMSQHLGALALSMTRLGQLTSEPKQVAIVSEMSASLREAVQQMRVVTYLMMPRGLLDEGLTASARRFADGLARRSGLEVRLTVSGDADATPASVQHAALRVLQEALTNVHRHADARGAEVALTSSPSMLEVSVADDGCGLPADGAGQGSWGVGILAMRARVEQLGGQFEVSGGPSGTKVTARLPLTPSRPGS